MSAAGHVLAVQGREKQRVGSIWHLALLVCSVVPSLLLAARFYGSVQEHLWAVDFQAYWASARDVLHGISPFPPAVPDAVSLSKTYPAGPYPAPVAILFASFGLLPLWLAGVLFTTVLVASVLVALRLLGVRDWRCYVAAFLWAPTALGIQTANLTLLFVLALAVLWRLRDRVVGPALAVGSVVALKLFLWPLIVWLLATRRYAAAAWSVVVAVAITLSSWGIVGFSHFRDYPRVAHIFAKYYETGSYTPFAFLVHVGVPTLLARAGGLALGLAALVAVVVIARRQRSDWGSFSVAVVAALLLTPIVWLHYFALLLVPLAVRSPRFSLPWLLPTLLWVCPWGAAPAAWMVALTLIVSGGLLLVARARWRLQQMRAAVVV